jgi:DNA-binding transcriptional MocR family regulator
MLVSINARESTPLVDQIVHGLSRQVTEGGLRPGTRVPSIREFARQHGVSRFTVVQAFDRLVAKGHLESRRGSGFYVARSHAPPKAEHAPVNIDRAVDDLWLIQRSTEEHRMEYMPGCGWLPGSWQDDTAIDRGLRRMAKTGAAQFVEGYPNAAGFLPLRQDIQRQMGDMGIEVDATQIALTSGAVSAIDLVLRWLIRPGDVVLVDDPGYFHTFGHLRALGARMIGVPWNVQGPDTEQLAILAEEYKPRAYLTTAVLHNPTGVTISQASAYRVLRAAEEHDFLVVEDDVYGALHTRPATRLATLDQLSRVIYVNSFSKTISPRLRVGYLAANPDIIRQLLDLKLLVGMASSEVTERLVHEVLADGYYRKHLAHVREHLERVRARTASRLERMGMVFFAPPEEGLFIWCRHPALADAGPIAETAAANGIMLAPGSSFRPNQEPSPWMRFNVAYADAPIIYETIERFIEEHGNEC